MRPVFRRAKLGELGIRLRRAFEGGKGAAPHAFEDDEGRDTQHAPVEPKSTEPTPVRPPLTGDRPVFVARNVDGLGERLRSICNAMALAEAFDGEFRVIWPDLRETLTQFHAILPADEFFTPQFVSRHVVDSTDLMAADPVLLADVKSGSELPVDRPILVPSHHLVQQMPEHFTRETATEAIRRVFRAIGFAPPMRRAVEAAQALDLPPEVASIHMRAGDIIYGMYRTMDDFHGKVVSYPVAEGIIARLQDKGVSPLIFGQDDSLSEWLCDTRGIMRADALRPADISSQTQQALFDICLLGRSTCIFAGSSGFAVMGSWLAGCKTEPPSSMISDEEAVDMIEASVLAPESDPRISPMQKAFAARDAFVWAKEPIATNPRLRRLLDAALENDPRNDFYRLIDALSYYATGDLDAGEGRLLDLFVDNERRLTPLWSSRSAQTDNRLKVFMPCLDAALEHDLPVARFLQAIFLAAEGDTSGAIAAYERYAAKRPARLAKVEAKYRPDLDYPESLLPAPPPKPANARRRAGQRKRAARNQPSAD